MIYLLYALLVVILGAAQAASDEHLSVAMLAVELSPITPVVFNSLVAHLKADINPLAGLLNPRIVQARQRTCPPGYGECKAHQGKCCPTGGACCSSTSTGVFSSEATRINIISYRFFISRVLWLWRVLLQYATM